METRPLLIAVCGALLAGCGGDDGRSEESEPVRGAAPIGACTGWPKFTPYYAGPVFEGMKVTNAEQTCGGSPPFENDPDLGAFLAYAYGDCEAEGDSGCTAPMEIQSRPLCDRQAHLEPGPRRGFDVRGARAVATRGGIEVYTGRTSVSFAGDDPARLRRAAAAIRPAPRSHLPRPGAVLDQLPPLGRAQRLGDLPAPDRAVLRKGPGCRFKGRAPDVP